jgi:hypothetical protein
LGRDFFIILLGLLPESVCRRVDLVDDKMILMRNQHVRPGDLSARSHSGVVREGRDCSVNDDQDFLYPPADRAVTFIGEFHPTPQSLRKPG